MPKSNQEKKKKIQPKLLKLYLDFLKCYQRNSRLTIKIRKNFVKQFLSEIGEIVTPSKLYKLSSKTIHDYIIKTFRTLHWTRKKSLVSSLRCFLRFAHICGYINKSLVEAVPVIATRRLDRIPAGISWEYVKKLYSSMGRNGYNFTWVP